jgi:hypothetical protein
MKVVKHSGDVVNFDRRKLQSSLEASGAEPVRVEEILNMVDQQLFEGISTRKFTVLHLGCSRKKSKATAARYNLKLAIQALGPAGFFFEKFMARLFEKEGYQTLVGQKLQGKSVSHEIDVLILKKMCWVLWNVNSILTKTLNRTLKYQCIFYLDSTI